MLSTQFTTNTNDSIHNNKTMYNTTILDEGEQENHIFKTGVKLVVEKFRSSQSSGFKYKKYSINLAY